MLYFYYFQKYVLFYKQFYLKIKFSLFNVSIDCFMCTVSFLTEAPHTLFLMSLNSVANYSNYDRPSKENRVLMKL